MSFYHSDDARAMATIQKNGQQNGVYPNINTSTSVPMPPPARTQRTPKWNWASTIFACIGTCVCCSICSTVGLLLSALSYADHKSGDYDRSKRKRCWSWVCTALAFAFGITIITLIVVAIAAFGENVEEWFNSAKDWIKERLCDLDIKSAC